MLNGCLSFVAVKCFCFISTRSSQVLHNFTYFWYTLQIVWDEKKKTWINTDGSDETSATVGPPPKIPQTIRGPPHSVSRSGNRSECLHNS